MLGIWQSHSDYQHFLIEQVNRQFKHNPRSIENYELAILKMHHLNLDLVKDDFINLFSFTGKPSNIQPELFRSFILMSHFKFASIDLWVKFASASPLISSLVGVSFLNFPDASTHRDFINRLWMGPSPNKLKKPISKPKGKHGKNKLPPNTSWYRC